MSKFNWTWKRERELRKLYASGFTATAIADRLGCSPQSVKRRLTELKLPLAKGFRLQRCPATKQRSKQTGDRPRFTIPRRVAAQHPPRPGARYSPTHDELVRHVPQIPEDLAELLRETDRLTPEQEAAADWHVSVCVAALRRLIGLRETGLKHD